MTCCDRRGIHASFVIAVTCSFVSAICDVIAFVTPYWIVAVKDANKGFQRLGLWEVCFRNFIFPEDYVSKAYNGCWYVYYPEYKYIRHWLNPAWFYAVQMLAILGLMCDLAGLLIIILMLCEVCGTKERRPNILCIVMETISLCCTVVNVITMACMGKNGFWLPGCERPRMSWSFAFACLDGFFAVFCIFGLVTHYLSVESRVMMEDPAVREKILRFNSKHGYQELVQEFEDSRRMREATGFRSKLAVTPSGALMTDAEAVDPSNVTSGVVGTTPTGTSAASVSERLRKSLRAQQAAVVAAKIRAAQDEPERLPFTVSLSSTRQESLEPWGSGGPSRSYMGARSQGSHLNVEPVIRMDSAV